MKQLFVLLCTALLLAACDDAAPPQVVKQEPLASSTDEIAKKLQQAAESISAPDFMSILDAAKRGDYQAQRNLAYGYVAYPYPGQEKNRVLGCAWYLVVLNSGHPQANVGDEGNVQTYCGALEKDLLETAKTRASQFIGEIKDPHS